MCSDQDWARRDEEMLATLHSSRHHQEVRGEAICNDNANYADEDEYLGDQICEVGTLNLASKRARNY